MKTIVAKTIKFKDKTYWEPGTEVLITVHRDNPNCAVLTRVSDTQTKRINSLHLCDYFSEFEKFTPEDVEAAICDSVCTSLTGETVEPDGWDSEGFPSLLLACGLM
jgi:hypothetical protein